MKTIYFALWTCLLLFFAASCSNPAPANEETSEEVTETPTEETPTEPVAMAGPGYKVGDIVQGDFKLKNVDGNMVSMADYPDAKGFVVIFTCNHCPYSIAYEDRIIALDQKYKAMGYPVIAINPNDPEIVAEDSYEEMITRAEEKGFTFPYLFDETQEVYPQYGATKTPHVYVVNKTDAGNQVVYTGAIDDSKEADAVTAVYLADAMDAIIKGETPALAETKAFGCSIKDKDDPYKAFKESAEAH